MSSRRSDDSVKLPATLTGLNLAISIAREATDAVPVVKQTLGAAVRILALAEKIDKDREALHALADRSLQLAQAFGSIKAFMTKHTRQTRLLRVIGCVFTVPLHVERLSRELGDAVQELVLVALVDVNHEARVMHELVAENARYVGEFRLLRHCDVEKLEPVQFHCLHKVVGVRYYRARVDGQLAVVRHFEVTECQNSCIVLNSGSSINYESITAHDYIIEELSTVQRSHRNVARIYGWSRGSSLERFTVFKSGYHPANSLLEDLPDPVTTGIHWAFKDAVHHLRLMGISWKGARYALDEHLEPMIGLRNDLCHMDHTAGTVFETQPQIYGTVYPFSHRFWRHEVPGADVQAVVADCHDKRLANLLSGLGAVTRRCVIPKADISHGFVLHDGTAERILEVLLEAELHAPWLFEMSMWADILTTGTEQEP